MSSLEAHPLDPAVPPKLVLEEAERRLAELAEAVAARDNFIAIAAHELRNPMTPMIGQIELLLKE
jgi:two-component system, OmpR family, sensor kinase